MCLFWGEPDFVVAVCICCLQWVSPSVGWDIGWEISDTSGPESATRTPSWVSRRFYFLCHVSYPEAPIL